MLVVGKTEPQRIFELLGRKGEVASERLALRDAYVEALDAYRRKAWEEARIGFEACLAIDPATRRARCFSAASLSFAPLPMPRLERRLVAARQIVAREERSPASSGGQALTTADRTRLPNAREALDTQQAGGQTGLPPRKHSGRGRRSAWCVRPNAQVLPAVGFG